MTKQEILEKWKTGLSKDTLAIMYKREYNNEIKKIRSNVVNRHTGKFISNYEALAKVEQAIYEHLVKNKNQT